MADARDEEPSEASTLLRKATYEEILAPVFRFVVTAGVDHGLSFTFDGTRPSRVLIGQSPSCDLRLTDRQVSRRHASLELTRRGLLLSDLESKNGTSANGVPIVAVYLVGGELVRLGDTTLRVDKLGAPAPVVLSEAMRFGRMVGASPEMRRLYPICKRIALADVPLVIEGETGTGKEVLAEAIHEASRRAAGPFIVFDCTTAPPNLLESALFGHERGAFTGAVASRKGVFEEAHGGTLLIDEIGELDVTLQPKLLRAIERAEVQRVGATAWTRVDARIIAATRRDLDHEVQVGRFRDDLFYRLAVARIELPPLRSRRGDVGVLARHFWHALGGDEQPLPAALLARMEDYAWPGNIRELHNTIARYLALGEADLGAGTLSGGAPSSAPKSAVDDVIGRALGLDLPLARARQIVVDEFERRYVKRVLDRYDGNVVRAAAASGIARRYFQILRALDTASDSARQRPPRAVVGLDAASAQLSAVYGELVERAYEERVPYRGSAPREGTAGRPRPARDGGVLYRQAVHEERHRAPVAGHHHVREILGARRGDIGEIDLVLSARDPMEVQSARITSWWPFLFFLQ